MSNVQDAVIPYWPIHSLWELSHRFVCVCVCVFVVCVCVFVVFSLLFTCFVLHMLVHTWCIFQADCLNIFFSEVSCVHSSHVQPCSVSASACRPVFVFAYYKYGSLYMWPYWLVDNVHCTFSSSLNRQLTGSYVVIATATGNAQVLV